MRKVIAWPLAHACYWIGHWAWLLIDRHPDANVYGEPRWHFTTLMWFYNHFFGWSYELNEWAGLSIWTSTPPECDPPETLT